MVIEKLGYDDNRIFEAELSADKNTLEITEACDMYFSVELTRDQVVELANDFMKLAEQMPNVELRGAHEK